MMNCLYLSGVEFNAYVTKTDIAVTVFSVFPHIYIHIEIAISYYMHRGSLNDR